MNKGDTLVWFGMMIAVFALFGGIPFAGMRTARIRKIGFCACGVGILVGLGVALMGALHQ